jgi:N-carbamoylputrescine amidase
MLHAAFRYDDVGHNVDLLERLLLKAVHLRPDIIITPELAVSGYEFFKAIGSGWIKTATPEIIARFSDLARANRVALILGTPRFRAASQSYHNAAIFIDEQGRIAGEYYKINVLHGSESWSSPGEEIKPVLWQGRKIGLLICSDAYTPQIAGELARQRANVLLSPAAWAPGLHGPDGEWEQRSQETGLSFFVCNRTGKEKELSFNGGSSVVAAGGRRLVNYAKERPAILTIEAEANDWLPLGEQFQVVEV